MTAVPTVTAPLPPQVTSGQPVQSVGNTTISTGSTAELTPTPKLAHPKVVAIVSGGLDSTTMLYDAVNKYDVVQAVSFLYGQRHQKELDYAEATCEKLHVPWSLIDLWSSGLTDLFSNSGSSLVNFNVDVPEGSYDDETMKATVVPNRNMIMISIAGGIAVAKDAQSIMLGVHAGDHAIYPDCRPRFIDAAQDALIVANDGFGNLSNSDAILTPFLFQTKTDIAVKAFELGVPFHETWSCYKGSKYHCGRCGTCVERLEAIDEAKIRILDSGRSVPSLNDLTQYDDTEFWKEATA